MTTVSKRKNGLIQVRNGRHVEVAYAKFALRGLKFEVELPSDWHEESRAWLRVCVGFMTLALSVPWKKVVPDECQCSGPIYGFNFSDGYLTLSWGKAKGLPDDPNWSIAMPWSWRFAAKVIVSEAKGLPFVWIPGGQERTVDVRVEDYEYSRPWVPWRKVARVIHVDFSEETGSRVGSWKGGCLSISGPLRGAKVSEHLAELSADPSL